jgi:hypothetical protein
MRKFIALMPLLVIILGVLTLRFSVANGAKDRPGNAKIRVESGRLTVAVKNTTLLAILAKVADQTGIRFEIHGKADRQVTANYIKIPLDEGLKRLLDNYSYIIVYTVNKSQKKGANIQSVIIYGKPGTDQVQRIAGEQTPSTAAAGKNSSKRDGKSVEESGKSLEATPNSCMIPTVTFGKTPLTAWPKITGQPH